MPLTSADLSRYYSNVVTTTVNRNEVWPNLCNRSQEASLQNQYQAELQDVSNWGNSFTDHTVGANWAAADDPDATQISMALDQVQESNTKLPWLQARLTPLEYTGLIALDRAAKLRVAHDTNMAAFFLAEAKALPTAQKVALGTDANYIAYATGVPSTDAAKLLVLEAVDRFLVYLREQDFLPQDGMALGGPIGSFWMMLQPKPMMVLLQALRDKGIQLDTLYDSILRSASVFDLTPFRGRLYGQIDLMTSTAIANPTTQAGKWDIVCGTTEWVYFGSLNALNTDIDPSVNRVAPNFEWHSLSAWGRVEVNSDQGFYVSVEAGTA